jgi:anti-sigma B factor antagonist
VVPLEGVAALTPPVLDPIGNDASVDGLVISARREEGVVAVRLAGELDLGDAGRIEAEVRKLLATGARHFEVDATELTFVDSAGLRSIVQAKQQAEAAGAAFRIRAVSAPVRRVIEVAGIADQLLPDGPT